MSKFKLSSELFIGGSSEIDAVFLPVNIDCENQDNLELWNHGNGDETHHHLYHQNHYQLDKHHKVQQNGDAYRGMGVADGGGKEKLAEEEDEAAAPTSVLMHAIVTDTPDSNDWCYRATLTSLGVIVIIVLVLIFGHSYIRSILLWLEQLEPTISISVLMGLFVCVCFPIAWGLSLLMVVTGYLFGFLYGPLVVCLCVTVGLSVSTPIMRYMCSSYLRSRFYSRKVEAIVNVVSGSHGMKVVALTRLTPIPFGLQNALFSLSSISLLRYVIASVGGLIPMTVLNTYMGSTLRNMQDLMTDESNRLTGCFIFGGQILITVVLLWFVVRKARVELKKAMDESDKSSTALPNGDCSKTVYVDHDGV